MTSEGIMSLFQAGTNATTLVDGSKNDNSKVSNEFSNLLSNSQGPVMSNTSSVVVSKASSVNQSYESMKYKGKDVDKATDTNPIREKLDECNDKIEEFEEKVVEIVSEDLDVSEDEVVKAMEELGLTVFDLLEPQNLSKLCASLQDIEDVSILVLDSDFQKLMSDLVELGKDLMNELRLEPSQFDEFIEMMDVLEQPVEYESVIEDSIPNEAFTSWENVSEDNASVEIETAGIQTEEAGNILQQSVNLSTEDENDLTKEDETVVEIIDEIETEVVSETENKAGGSGSENASGKDDSFKPEHHKLNENVSANNEFSNQVNDNLPVNEASNNSYVSMDTVELIHEIAERIKVAVGTEVSTMQMELNPENLGKIYLNVSVKEGATNAQIMATNEAVKEAIESQIVNLKETLQHSGMKVEEVEVSVATHEFERNLEQHHSREEQEGAYQEEQKSKRRNINMSSLDELSGIMSEEEALVAQMMKDNGNSVDLTA